MRSKIVVIAAVLALCAVAGRAQQLSERVEEFTLENGMRFLLVDRDVAPVFAGVIMVKVGSVDEPEGRTGIAHMFEHMAFKGTSVIGTKDWEKEKPILDEIDQWGKKLSLERTKGPLADQAVIDECKAKIKELYEKQQTYTDKDKFSWWYTTNGATALNAGTGPDLTSYFVMLPVNRLELWCLLESERLLNPVFREFYSERDVVMEERRMGVDTDPDGALGEAFRAAAFESHPYRHPIVGWGSDVMWFTKDMAIDFFRKYYTTKNLIGVIVGDIDQAKTKALLKEYFGRIPEGDLPVRYITEEPPQKGERRVAVDFDAEPKFRIGYHKPNAQQDDGIVLDVIADILGNGRSSRLYAKLVKEKELCADISVFAHWPGSRYNNLMVISGEPIHPHTVQECEAAVYQEIERLKSEPVTDRELAKVLNNIVAEEYWQMTNNLGIAFIMAYSYTLYGDYNFFQFYLDKVKKVTKDDIQRCARQYLTESNRTVAYIKKKTTPEQEGKQGEVPSVDELLAQIPEQIRAQMPPEVLEKLKTLPPARLMAIIEQMKATEAK